MAYSLYTQTKMSIILLLNFNKISHEKWQLHDHSIPLFDQNDNFKIMITFYTKYMNNNCITCFEGENVVVIFMFEWKYLVLT